MVRTDPDGFVALVASWSWIVNLDDGERTGFLGQVRELIGDQRELALRYRTESTDSPALVVVAGSSAHNPARRNVGTLGPRH